MFHKRMSLSHAHGEYEELCAILAAGEALPNELVRLTEHLRGCRGCRDLLHELARISTQYLPAQADERIQAGVPVGMIERVVERARLEGTSLSSLHGTKRWVWFNWGRPFWAMAISAVIVPLAVLTFWAVHHGKRHATADSYTASSTVISPTPAFAIGSNKTSALPPTTELTAQLRVAHTQLVDLETKLKTADLDRAQLTSKVSALDQTNAELRKAEEDRDSTIGQLQGEVRKVRLEQNAEHAASATLEADLEMLRAKLTTQTVELNQERQLNGAARQAREVLIARNLHMVDVLPDTSDGKTQKAFGRIFYTEGKSLIFYAYDLADPSHLDAKNAFYVWGEKLGTTRPVRGLGVLHSDDQRDGRWLLTYDDPGVLTQIDSVFVTVESAKRPTEKPTGRKMLIAFFGDKANHP